MEPERRLPQRVRVHEMFSYPLIHTTVDMHKHRKSRVNVFSTDPQDSSDRVQQVQDDVQNVMVLAQQNVMDAMERGQRLETVAVQAGTYIYITL